MKKRGIKGEESPKKGGGSFCCGKTRKKKECVQYIIWCNT